MLKRTAKASLLFVLVHYTKCGRGISGGERVSNATFVVYIVWDLSNETHNEYSDIYTICGGALIRPNAVMTSGTCLKIIPIQYVIAGYDRYVPGGIGRNKDEQNCMQIAKIPIIEKCYLHGISKSEINFETWYKNDVAIARLQTAYDLDDSSFISKCSYKPTTATWTGVDMEAEVKNNQEMPVVVYGWGSAKYQVPENYSYDINQEFLMATATRVISQADCADFYQPYYDDAISHTRFCTDGNATINRYGKYLSTRRANSSAGSETMYILNVEKLHKNKIYNISAWNTSEIITRRNGPCQNDHGGPVVYWLNGVQTIVGVITGYLVNSDLECVGPYLYSDLSSRTNYLNCIFEKLDLGEVQTSRRLMEHCQHNLKNLDLEEAEEVIDLVDLYW